VSQAPAITEAARRLVGTVIEREQSLPISAHHVRQYLVGTNDRNRAYLPHESGERSITPPLFVLAALRQLVYRDELAADGQHRALAVGGISGRTIEGGTDFTLHTPVFVGDVLKMTRTLVSLDQKVGRSGPMVIVVTNSRFENQQGTLVAELDHTIIFK
jgi:3-methylfumaryl-CoA hydratase